MNHYSSGSKEGKIINFPLRLKVSHFNIKWIVCTVLTEIHTSRIDGDWWFWEIFWQLQKWV